MSHALSKTLSAAALRSASPTAVTLLRVSGEDAFTYLQSQVSADLRVSGVRQWVRYALWLDASGHVLADSFILSEGAESFLLFSYNTPADRLEEIVLSNVIADDVEVEQLGGGYRHWALWESDAAAGASEAGAELMRFFPQTLSQQEGSFALLDLQQSAAEPAAGATVATGTGADGGNAAADADPNAVAAKSSADTDNAAAIAKSFATPVSVGLLFAGRNTGGANYDLLLPQGAALPSFATLLTEVPWAEREAQRIADGVPAVPQDIGTGDLPQDGGDLPRAAVSTSKGCYLGQEMVARWHATGQVRSGLYRVQLLAGGTSEAVATLADGGLATDGGLADGGASTLPLRLYAGTKPVGQLRSFAPSTGAGLALLRIHRLGDARALSLEAGGAEVFSVQEPMLS